MFRIKSFNSKKSERTNSGYKKVSKVLEEGHEVYKPHFITRYLSLVDEKYRLRIDNKFRYRLGEKKVISLWDISLKDILLHQIGKGFIHSIKYPSKEFLKQE